MDDLTPKLLDLIFDPRSLEIAQLTRGFNPFRVLRVEKYELRHTNTLAWLLSPTASHGLGSAFAAQFLKAICDREESKSGLGMQALAAIAKTDIDAIHVRREVSSAQLETLDKSDVQAAIEGVRDTPAEGPFESAQGEEEEDEGEVEGSTVARDSVGRLDVLIEGTGWVVAVEAKVSGKQGTGQLTKYSRSLSLGAPTSRIVRAYLTNDGSESVPNDWVSVSWKDMVAAPLKRIILGLPHSRRAEPQIAFIESFLEVLDENCVPAEGRREVLLKSIASEYEPLLQELRKRVKKDALSDTESELVRRQIELINLLQARYMQPNEARRPILESVLRSDPRFDLRVSTLNYLYFTPQAWSGFPWLAIGGTGVPGVTCELVNFERGIRLKIQIRHLLEPDENQLKRQHLLHLIRSDQRGDTEALLPRAFLQPKKKYFSIFWTPFVDVPLSESEGALKTLLDGPFAAALDRLTDIMHMV